ncbi:MAG: hypothetical protein Kow0037_29340 [Calditrichia bacterium]
MNLHLFYHIKPFLPRFLQLLLRRLHVRVQKCLKRNIWPIDPSAGRKPDNWPGWPNRARFAVVLTHDVESQKGHDRCKKLMELEARLGFRSSFNFVPEGYTVSSELRRFLEKNGFEVGVHGLNHDGRLYSSRQEFLTRAKKINHYLREWQVVGFRSPSMHHNLEWLHNLDIAYDLSTFDVDPFEPQPDGVKTIFPFWVEGRDGRDGYAELPYTLVQDFTLFVLMREKTIDLWKQKVDWIVENGGMVLVNVHPDYLAFDGAKPTAEEFPARLYQDLLQYLNENYAGQYWNPLPREMADFVKQNRISYTGR